MDQPWFCTLRAMSTMATKARGLFESRSSRQAWASQQNKQTSNPTTTIKIENGVALQNSELNRSLTHFVYKFMCITLFTYMPILPHLTLILFLKNYIDNKEVPNSFIWNYTCANGGILPHRVIVVKGRLRMQGLYGGCNCRAHCYREIRPKLLTYVFFTGADLSSLNILQDIIGQ